MLDKSYQHFVKIAQDTQINKTMDPIPDKETHGLWLAATNIVKTIQNIKKANISIKTSYLGVDALSQVIGTMRTPQVLEQH